MQGGRRSNVWINIDILRSPSTLSCGTYTHKASLTMAAPHWRTTDPAQPGGLQEPPGRRARGSATQTAQAPKHSTGVVAEGGALAKEHIRRAEGSCARRLGRAATTPARTAPRQRARRAGGAALFTASPTNRCIQMHAGNLAASSHSTKARPAPPQGAAGAAACPRWRAAPGLQAAGPRPPPTGRRRGCCRKKTQVEWNQKQTLTTDTVEWKAYRKSGMWKDPVGNTRGPQQNWATGQPADAECAVAGPRRGWHAGGAWRCRGSACRHRRSRLPCSAG
jgi:hypothetical protein